MSQNPPAPVAFIDGLSHTLLRHVGSAGRHERGGVLLGRRHKGKTVVAAVVFPPQIYSGPDHCIFEVRSIEAIRAAFALLTPKLRRVAGTIVGWVHSHPGLGLFLSHTDIATFTTWRQLDTEAVAVVVDPLTPGTDSDRVAYWHSEQTSAGSPFTFIASPRDALTVADGTALADQIKRAAQPDGAWEIITAHHVVSVFPKPGRSAATGIEPELVAVMAR